jgi:hypothetical protein
LRCGNSTVADNGFRLDERGVEPGGWLHYGSTTARGEIWIAGVPPLDCHSEPGAASG